MQLTRVTAYPPDKIVTTVDIDGRAVYNIHFISYIILIFVERQIIDVAVS